MKKNPKNNENVLDDYEFAKSVEILGKLLPISSLLPGRLDKEKIKTHLQLIASSDSLALTNPTFMYNNAKAVSSDAALTKFYKQLEYLFFTTRTNSQSDFYVRLCNNLVAGLAKQTQTDYSVSINGGILDLAKQLYKKSFLEYFIKPTDQKVLRVFLMDHPNIVLQLLISQYFQHEQLSQI